MRLGATMSVASSEDDFPVVEVHHPRVDVADRDQAGVVAFADLAQNLDDRL